MTPEDLFRDDYNLDALQRIVPLGQQFEMLVTPRFVGHYVQNRYEPLTARLMRAIAPRKKLFLDVGAHYGFFSILTGLANPGMQIHAIEPVPENHEVLRRNLELHDLSRVTCHAKAASDEETSRQFLKSRAADNASFHAHPAAPSVDEIVVETLRLSSLLANRGGVPTLIKIDTEGHEISVLEGIGGSLSGGEDTTLIVELNPKMLQQSGHEPADLLRKLEAMGFATFLVQEDPARLLRLDAGSDWRQLMPETGAANLYCRPRQQAMSICFLAHSHSLAGAERSMLELVTQLVEDHGTVCNVVIPGDGPLVRDIEGAGAGVIPAEYGWWCSNDAPTREEIQRRLGDDFARLLATTLPDIEATGPDLISTNSMVIPHGALVAAFLGKPHVWHLREYGSELEGHRFYLPKEERLGFIEDFSDFLFTATRSLGRKLLPHLAADRTDHLYPAIQAPAPGRPPSASHPASPAQPLRLVDLASIMEAKQQEVDVRALAELCERNLEATLLLKGPQDPRYVERLRRLAKSLGIADRLTFEGFSEDIWSVLQQCDVVLISSPRHCFGRIAAEGMLSARPVVYPRQTDIAEYMEDGLTGLAYDAGDFRGMADQVERLIRRPQLAREIGERARATAVGLFTRAAFGDKFLARARELVTRGPSVRPSLPPLLVESLVAGIQRLSSHAANLEQKQHSQTEEIDSLHGVLEAKEGLLAAADQELASVKRTLELKSEELDSIKPVLAARDVELANVYASLEATREKLERLLSTRLGRLAARQAKID